MKQNTMLQRLRSWSEQGLIRAVDYQFARFISDSSDTDLPEHLLLLAALTSQQLAQGNVCLPLAHLLEPEYFWPQELADEITAHSWQSLTTFESVLGQGESLTPLVFDQQRFYLYRYWRYEVEVAAQLQQRAQVVTVDEAQLGRDLIQLFPANDSTDEIDWQQIAAAVAVQKGFAVISGGPGTGKTTTVIKLLALYIQQMQASGQKINIRLAAPTGKAAARLSESISAAKQRLGLSDEVTNLIPENASTLHRLLGVIPDRIEFRHNRSNPLHLDLLVLDEASMVDLPMMARLLDALPQSARLILLGDRDQLASVEAGSVLGDICSWPGELNYSAAQSQQLRQLCQLPEPLAENPAATAFSDSLCLLRKSYRFHEQSGIGHLARAVNQGDIEQLRSVLAQGYKDLELHSLNPGNYEEMIATAAGFYAELLRSVFSSAEPAAILQKLSEFQLLTALREGPYGVSGINERIRDALSSRGLIKTDATWYPGRPVMISQNDNALALFNGDIGVALPDEAGRLRVWFEQNGALRSILPSRLPEHETVFAMTVHKSQGSEFNQVVLLLPPVDTPVLSRELLYTGITRAKSRLSLYAVEQTMIMATERKTARYGGLTERLW